MKQKTVKIILIILIVVIAVLAVCIFLGGSFFSGLFQNLAASPAQGGATSSLVSESSPPSQIIITNESQKPISSADAKDLFSNPSAYISKNVQITGIVSDDPQNKEGLVVFNIQTSDNQYACINYLDMDKKLQLNKNDKVTVTGIVTNSVTTNNPNGLPVQMPMINANSIAASEK